MRKSIRLPHWDYRNNSWYFVTICTRDRVCYFGDIVNYKMDLSPVGEIAQQCWANIPHHSQYTAIDTYIVMPNHIHGIIIIDRPDGDVTDNRDVTYPNGDVTDRRDVIYNVPTANYNNAPTVNPIDDFARTMSKLSPKTGSLSVIIRTYKAAVTRWCKRNGYNDFAWQPRFYESIIRDSDSLEKIQNYIVNNPAKWQEDENNPMNFRI
ncbi:MAG: transposase [Cyanobacteriota bacterium]|nr:transposase [Cyanobacteriota bacterium]